MHQKSLTFLARMESAGDYQIGISRFNGNMIIATPAAVANGDGTTSAPPAITVVITKVGDI